MLFGDVFLVSNAYAIFGDPHAQKDCTKSHDLLAVSGLKYFVYRVLIYCDDFQPFSILLPQGSAGSWYLLSLAPPPQWRPSQSSVRLLGLTPMAVSTNEMQLNLIDDIIEMTTFALDGWDSEGRHVKIFIDVVGYISDFLALTHVLNVLGYNAAELCLLCTFYRQRTNENSAMDSQLKFMQRAFHIIED